MQHRATTRKAEAGRTTGLFIVPIILTLIGLYFVFEASSIRALNYYDDSFYFVKRQMLWAGLGVCAMYVVSKISYTFFYKIALPLVILGLGLLLAVLVPGIGQNINGARRWISVASITFQPTELMKLAVICYLAAWFKHRERKRILAFTGLLLVTSLLIMLQPDMGTAMILVFISLGMYFLAGVDIKQLLWLLPAMFLGAIITASSATYRLNRIKALLNAGSDPEGVGYHVRQIAIAVQNGGFFGLGFGASRQKYLYLPEAHTDSIFAIIIEEMGLLGGMSIMFLYILLVYYVYRITIQCKERFAYMIGCGVLLYFALQSIINLSAVVQIIPLTGVPLPFISNGGTSLFISFVLVGIMLNIEKHFV